MFYFSPISWILLLFLLLRPNYSYGKNIAEYFIKLYITQNINRYILLLCYAQMFTVINHIWILILFVIHFN